LSIGVENVNDQINDLYQAIKSQGIIMHYNTKIIHNSGSKDVTTGGLSIPISPASTYQQSDIDNKQEFLYSRSGNPTRKALEETLAVLENGKRAFAFSSGVAAITACLTGLLKSNDHVIATENIYGGTYRILDGYLSKFNINYSLVDTSDPKAVEDEIKKHPDTKILFLETPTNPLLKITDIEKMAELAKKYKLISIIDNTFLTPYFLKPLDFGIDVSIHSATKFLAGHSDLIAGAAVTNCDNIASSIHYVQNTTGNILSPENCWLLIRGIKTLRARLEIEQESAIKIADWLSKQSWVKKVYYPGFKSHQGHSIIKKQASGFGAVVSFETDTLERARTIMKNIKIWSLAVSLGGVESILSYPFIMSHQVVPESEKNKIGITDRLLRLSCGLEDCQDLIDDLNQAVIL
jgi:cystathionine beta-lyase/cystathionine gamma-synthase